MPAPAGHLRCSTAELHKVQTVNLHVHHASSSHGELIYKYACLHKLSVSTSIVLYLLQVVPTASWDMLIADVNSRLAARPGAVQHMLVLLPVPIVYPKIPVSEKALAGIAGEDVALRPNWYACFCLCVCMLLGTE